MHSTAATRRSSTSHASKDGARRTPATAVVGTASPVVRMLPLVAMSSEEVVPMDAKRKHRGKRVAAEVHTETSPLPHQAPRSTPRPIARSCSAPDQSELLVPLSSEKSGNRINLLPLKTQASADPTSGSGSPMSDESHLMRFRSGRPTKTPPKPVGGLFKRPFMGGAQEGSTVITGSGGAAAAPVAYGHAARLPYLSPMQPGDLSECMRRDRMGSLKGSSVTGLPLSVTPRLPRRNTVSASDIETKK
ncbi:hypothetical protein STCU_10598 [Strigomonas culicis]|uniref:Uncharacterized protein n=1 Tax=Strigomonas culicis TaxID=28005 RepID=S9V3M9_9TRYP|nr:hypothetical protein STCU_10598 [Strigomonas culicis]|eukprot:EPY17465.1 hypothetical protein STCU_10598 [Strigomonas culicis]